MQGRTGGRTDTRTHGRTDGQPKFVMHSAAPNGGGGIKAFQIQQQQLKIFKKISSHIFYTTERGCNHISIETIIRMHQMEF